MEGEWRDNKFYNGVKTIANADGTTIKVMVKDGKPGDRVITAPYLEKEIKVPWSLPK